MKKLLASAFHIIVAVSCSYCLAEIPQGQWMKKDIDSVDVYQSLAINFDKPKNISNMLAYGSLALQWAWPSDTGWYLFSKPEISGNNALCKAYYFEQYPYSEESDKLFSASNESVDCEISYNESSETVMVSVEGKNFVFPPNSRCNRIVSKTNNLNVRKAPVNGQKNGTMTMGQTLPMLSVAPQKKGDDWYEVQLPDGNTGFVSGQFVECVSPSWLSIPFGMIKPNVSYVHGLDSNNPQFVQQTSLQFICKGNQVMCYSSTVYPLAARMGIEEFLMGKIEENKFIFDRSLPAFGSDVDVYQIFDSGNFAEFAKHATKMENPEIFYFDSNYANGRFFDAKGIEYNAHEF